MSGGPVVSLPYEAASSREQRRLAAASVVSLQRLVGNQRATAALQRQETATASLMDQAREAMASRGIEELKACNRRARAMMKANPTNPPQEARDALATIRHFVMDQVAAIYDQYTAWKEQVGIGATSGAQSGQDRTGYIEAADTWFDQYLEPTLGVLMEGDPQYRYEHFNRDVQEKVFAVLRLRASRRALAQIGHRAAAEAEAREVGQLPKGAWCGAFAFTQQNKAAGMDKRWASFMQGEGGIRGALAYYGTAANPWIWAFDHWERLKDYHSQRGSLRWYEAIQRRPPARGIQPGDIVLIDNARGTDPDHVTTAVSFDGRYLATMGGNQGSSASTDESGVSRNRVIDLTQNPDANDVRLRDRQGNPIPDTTDPTKTKNVRVHGVGRWSIVDYEEHIYRAQAAKPTKPPSAAEIAAVS